MSSLIYFEPFCGMKVLMDHSSVTFLDTGHRVRKSAHLYVDFDFWATLCLVSVDEPLKVTVSGTGRRKRRKQNFMSSLFFALFREN